MTYFTPISQTHSLSLSLIHLSHDITFLLFSLFHTMSEPILTQLLSTPIQSWPGMFPPHSHSLSSSSHLICIPDAPHFGLSLGAGSSGPSWNTVSTLFLQVFEWIIQGFPCGFPTNAIAVFPAWKIQNCCKAWWRRRASCIDGINPTIYYYKNSHSHMRLVTWLASTANSNRNNSTLTFQTYVRTKRRQSYWKDEEHTINQSHLHKVEDLYNLVVVYKLEPVQQRTTR